MQASGAFSIVNFQAHTPAMAAFDRPSLLSLVVLTPGSAPVSEASLPVLPSA